MNPAAPGGANSNNFNSIGDTSYNYYPSMANAAKDQQRAANSS
jgi:hypothetical protein